MIRQATSALAKLPVRAGAFNRGTQLPETKLALHQPGKVVTYPAFTSASAGHGFSGTHRFLIEGKGGKDVKFISAHPGEEEILFQPGSRFKVLERVEKGGKVYIRLRDVD